MRTFVAIPLPASLRQVLADATPVHDAIRPTPAAQMHITLKFIGEQPRGRINRIADEISQIQSQLFYLQLQGWGTFPQSGSPKVLWSRVEPADALQKLQQQIEDICHAHGVEKKQRPYIPHVTLGRINGRMLRQEIEEKMRGYKVMQEFIASSIGIYESRLSSGGAVHSLIKKYPLPA